MLKKIKKVTLLLVCVMSLVLPSISSLAASVEPRAQYAYCSSCDSLGVRKYRTEQTNPVPYATGPCDICGTSVQYYMYKVTSFYECINCYDSYEETEYYYPKACGH